VADQLRKVRSDLPVILLAVVLLICSVVALAPAEQPRAPQSSPWHGKGVWIWYLSDSPEVLAAKLKKANMDTVFIKSADGDRVWRQFNKALVSALQDSGIHVCGWQYVYGKHPLREARAAASVKAAGADCFVIDAEKEYKHRHRQAAIYTKELRRLLGPSFEIGFSSFPYLRLHKSMPYRTFLGPGAATANLPQMYWKEIGVSPERILKDTYLDNLALGRPVYPIGQSWRSPPAKEIARFSKRVKKLGGQGLSWWSLDHSSKATWKELSR
jgi:hypothetical protein